MLILHYNREKEKKDIFFLQTFWLCVTVTVLYYNCFIFDVYLHKNIQQVTREQDYGKT